MGSFTQNAFSLGQEKTNVTTLTQFSFLYLGSVPHNLNPLSSRLQDHRLYPHPLDSRLNLCYETLYTLPNKLRKVKESATSHSEFLEEAGGNGSRIENKES